MEAAQFTHFTGTVSKLTLVCFPSMYPPGGSVQSKLTIRSDGKVDYTTIEHNFPVIDEDSPARSGGTWEKRKMLPEKAQELLEAIALPFRTLDSTVVNVCDGDMWELTITNTDGVVFHYSGFSISNCFDGANEISYHIRDKLLLPDFPAFDNSFCDHIRQEDDFIFCDVQMLRAGYGRSYWYLTDNEELGIGDKVVAPFGKENREVIGKIISIMYRPADEAPFSIEKTKKILRKCTEEDLEAYKPDHVIGFCPLYELEINNEQCDMICEFVNNNDWAEEMEYPLPEFATMDKIMNCSGICECCPLRHRFD